MTRHLPALRLAAAEPAALLVALAAGLLVGHAPAMAQYKVVAPDGTITYTDRPVAAQGSKVQSIRAGVANAGAVNATPAAPVLPADLRNVVARYPVTLYTSTDCAPCDSGRRLLQQRGVPFAERLITSEPDAAALQKLSNGRTVPSIAIGAQVERGFQDQTWHSLLDLAGYPRESRLPRDWPASTPTPLAARAPAPASAPVAAAPAPAAPPVAQRPLPAEPATPGQPNIRF